ncbi:CCR4-NOT transcription complex subunit 9, partial [Sarracenia purpurea var. burkii]
LFQDLAPLLWNSFGTVAALLQEIVSIYPVLSPPNLSPAQSNRVCNALALLQCVASHPDTRMLFLNAHIPLYLYPFLNTTSKSRPFEYLRLTSLGVIGALVKVDDTEVISFLLSTEIIPLCLRTMEMGSELSKTVATFIVQKILLDDVGLDYICTTAERFFAVGQVLGNMVAALAEQPSPRLLKHIIRCYLRLSDNSRACDALRSCLPDMLRDATFSTSLREDPTTRRWLQQLLHNVQVHGVSAQPGRGFDHMLEEVSLRASFSVLGTFCFKAAMIGGWTVVYGRTETPPKVLADVFEYAAAVAVYGGYQIDFKLFECTTGTNEIESSKNKSYMNFVARRDR